MVRTGLGHDVHRIDAGRPLVLGGVNIPGAAGLAGHSDADVVLHAICDALLGAAGLGDIGEMFPNTDPANRNADSRRFVREVVNRVRERGFRPINVDVMVLAEKPHLAAHKPAMRASIAALLDLPIDAINVKAGTNEGMDAVGRGEAIACLAAALISSVAD